MKRKAQKNLLKTVFCLTLTLIFMFTLTAGAFASTTISVQRYNTSTQKNEAVKVITVSIFNGDEEIKTDVPAMGLNGKTLVPVRAVTETLGAKVKWNSAKRQATVTKGKDTIVLTVGSSKAVVNGKSVSLPGNISAELITYKGSARTMVPFRFISEQLGAKVAWNNNAKKVTINPVIDNSDDWLDWADTFGVQVVIDPGHGGSDPGAVANDSKEKEINLQVAERVSKNLTKKGITVIMTRTEDEYLELVERANIGTDAMATVFVSMHCNSATATSATGVETYYYINSDNEYDEDLADCIQKAVIKATGAKDRGVKSANFSVLRNSEIPAALIEMGFISNADEAANLNDEEYQKQIATGVTNGIIAFLKAYDLL
ncbi:MAG: N-acetylmuramoyl-L-alanine amidase [Bacillota bacterium]|jgi:N-acetylmuramoyl-L-alanine amidase CwlD